MAVGVLPPPHAVKPAIPNQATPSKTQCRFIYYTALWFSRRPEADKHCLGQTSDKNARVKFAVWGGISIYHIRIENQVGTDEVGYSLQVQGSQSGWKRFTHAPLNSKHICTYQ